MIRPRRTKRAKLIRKADKLFSLYIRKRDKYTCVRCHTRHDPKSMGLHCSHFFGRTRIAVRFDERNGDCLCYGCHKYWEKEDREAYREFKLKQLGGDSYNDLFQKQKIMKTSVETLEQIVTWLEKELNETY